jgi:hypothetical protein
LLDNRTDPIPHRWGRTKVLVIAVVFGAVVTAGFLSLRLFRDTQHERPRTAPVRGVNAGS